MASDFHVHLATEIRRLYQTKETLSRGLEGIFDEYELLNETRVRWDKYEKLDRIEFEDKVAMTLAMRPLPDGSGFLALNSMPKDKGINFSVIDHDGVLQELVEIQEHLMYAFKDFRISPDGKMVYIWSGRVLCSYDFDLIMSKMSPKDTPKKDRRDKLLLLSEQTRLCDVATLSSLCKVKDIRFGKNKIFAILAEQVAGPETPHSIYEFGEDLSKGKEYRIPQNVSHHLFFVSPQNDDPYYITFSNKSTEKANFVYCGEKDDVEKTIELDHCPDFVEVTPEGKFLITLKTYGSKSKTDTVHIFDIRAGKTIKTIENIPFKAMDYTFEEPDILLDKEFNITVFNSYYHGGVINKIGKKK